MEREMKIRGLLMDPTTNSPIVLLKDLESEMMLPIWVRLYGLMKSPMLNFKIAK